MELGWDIGNTLKFHHIHLYVDDVRSLEEYKALERTLNAFAEKNFREDEEDMLGFKDMDRARRIWDKVLKQ